MTTTENTTARAALEARAELLGDLLLTSLALGDAAAATDAAAELGETTRLLGDLRRR